MMHASVCSTCNDIYGSITKSKEFISYIWSQTYKKHSLSQNSRTQAVMYPLGNKVRWDESVWMN